MFYSSGEESIRRSSHEEDLAPLVQNGESRTGGGKTSSRGEDQWVQSDNWVMSTTWDMQLDSSGETGSRLERGQMTFHFG